MLHGFPQLRFDGTGIRDMPVGCNALRNTFGDCACGTEECFRRAVALLTQQDIDEIALAINGTVQVGPAPFHFDIGLVNIPASTNSAPSMLAQSFTHQGGQLCFPRICCNF